MKSLKYFVIPFIITCLFLSACKGKEPATPDSEKAMDNFLAKIAEGNYTIDAPFLKATAYSKDLVYFDYEDELYTDYAVMSVNDEVFQASLTEGGLENLKFVQEGQALDAAGKKLVNYWMDDDVSQGNIYNLFYNIQEEPLKFVSYEDVVKQSLLPYMGYNEMALGKTEEVYVEFDAEDPTTAHITAVIEDDEVARIYYDDIDITLTFGNAEVNAAADAWMKAPAYPAARTEWTPEDEFIFDSVFFQGYGEDAVPFPTFASYALTIDSENYIWDDVVSIRDSHATEADATAYRETLLQNGFTEAKEKADDGTEKTCYRRLLREAYRCYDSIEVEYDNGVNITAKKYYDFPVYENLDAINAEITKYGYTPLPASDAFTSFYGKDTAVEQTESWLYFFDYDIVLYVDVVYEDYDAVMTYLADYEKTLADASFIPGTTDEDGEEIDYYESEDGTKSFRYHFDADGGLQMLFKAEKMLSASEVESMISAAGFPAIDLKDPAFGRDLRKYAKARTDQDMNIYLAFNQSFATVDEAGAFFDAYEAALVDAGFGRVNPENVGSYKQIALYNEEKNMVVGIDFIEEEDGASIYYDFMN